jgi:aspartate/methionine/tyrosine aminotransferase
VSSTALSAAGTRHGLHIVPGTAFGVDGVLDDHLRVPYILPPERLREAAARLARAQRDADGLGLSRPAYV